jgi:hypothetical protein
MVALLFQESGIRSDWGVAIVLIVFVITAVISLVTWWGYRKRDP